MFYLNQIKNSFYQDFGKMQPIEDINFIMYGNSIISIIISIIISFITLNIIKNNLIQVTSGNLNQQVNIISLVLISIVLTGTTINKMFTLSLSHLQKYNQNFKNWYDNLSKDGKFRYNIIKCLESTNYLKNITK